VRCQRPPILASLAATAAVSLTIAGCGSNSVSSSSSGGQLSQAQIQQGQQDAIRFVDCMRSHGVPNIPDPTTSPRGFKESLDPSIQRPPAFISAVRACQHLLPRPNPSSQNAAHSQAQKAAMLAFARCIRSHGFPSFPDPTSSGEVSHQMLAQAGINLHQPAVLQAGDACVGVTHGLITKAAVASFVAGQ
jgi:hypothetical protein